MKKKVLVLIYEGCVAFEIAVATNFLNGDFEIVTAGVGSGPYNEWSGLLFVAHTNVNAISMADYEALIIPGGRWEKLLLTPEVTALIQTAYSQGKLVAAICAAPIHLAKAGILKEHRFTTSLSEKDDPEGHFPWANYTKETVVVDGQVITANGNAYVDFAVAIADKFGLFKNEEEREMIRRYYKNI